MKHLGDQRGQALILMLLCMTCLLGFTAFATDVGLLFRARRNVQIAADSAAIAGAAELNYGDAAAAAQAAATQNGVTNGSNGAAVAVNIGPNSGPYSGNTAYVEVIASQSQPTFFMNLFNRTSMGVSARAVATNGAGQGCIYTLGSSGSDILINGSGAVDVQQCSIVNNSGDRRAALLDNGTGTITAQSIGVVGGVLENGCSTCITPTPITGIAPASNPLAYLSPPANPGSCTSQTFNGPPVGGATYTLGPAAPGGAVCYSGITINGIGFTVTLNPGFYYMTGSLTINGSPTVTGTGVTLYLSNSSSFTDNGGPTLNLSAPTAGTYNGILFYQSPSNSQALVINGSGNSTLEGIVYAPSAQVTLNGSNNTNFYTSVVANSLLLNGSGTVKDYAVINGSSDLTTTRLVE